MYNIEIKDVYYTLTRLNYLYISYTTATKGGGRVQGRVAAYTRYYRIKNVNQKNYFVQGKRVLPEKFADWTKSQLNLFWLLMFILLKIAVLEKKTTFKP